MKYLLGLFMMLAAAPWAWGVSVREFGAKGDGKTDDTQAIQQALRSGQGPVELPAGRYLLTDTLQLPSHGGLVGSGTLYQSADKVTLAKSDSETTLSGVVIRGIRIEKKFVENSKIKLISIRNAVNLQIDGVELTGGSLGNGIDLDQCRNFTVTNCYIHDFWGSGTDRDWNISGICIQHSSHGQIIGNRIINLTLTDKSIDAVGYQTDGMEIGNCSHLTFVGNVVRNVGEGTDMLVCSSCTVTGNTYDQCWNFGVKVIHGTHLSSVTGNTIRNAGLAGITVYFGNVPHGDIYGNAITGNTIVNTGAITRANGPWKTWAKAGIELVNCDMGPGNLVTRNLVANNVIYDDQQNPTCHYGINERHVAFPRDRKASVDPKLFATNQITGNLIQGMKVKPLQAISPMK